MERGRRTSVGIRPQDVPGAADRVEQPPVPGTVDLAAQVADVYVHDVALGVEVQPPHVLGEQRTREDASGIAQEIFEERVLAGGELDAPAAARHLARGGVEREVGQFQDRLPAARGAAPGGAHARGKTAERERVWWGAGGGGGPGPPPRRRGGAARGAST